MMTTIITVAGTVITATIITATIITVAGTIITTTIITTAIISVAGTIITTTIITTAIITGLVLRKKKTTRSKGTRRRRRGSMLMHTLGIGWRICGRWGTRKSFLLKALFFLNLFHGKRLLLGCDGAFLHAPYGVLGRDWKRRRWCRWRCRRRCRWRGCDRPHPMIIGSLKGRIELPTPLPTRERGRFCGRFV
jgi:hypothetical protein